jgi:hypothetical protein
MGHVAETHNETARFLQVFQITSLTPLTAFSKPPLASCKSTPSVVSHPRCNLKVGVYSHYLQRRMPRIGPGNQEQAFDASSHTEQHGGSLSSLCIAFAARCRSRCDQSTSTHSGARRAHDCTSHVDKSAAPPVWMHLDSGPSAFLSLIVADCTGVTAKLTLRTELARLGITSGRIPIKWGSKAIETASAAELKWYVSSTSLVSSVHDWGLLAQCI